MLVKHVQKFLDKHFEETSEDSELQQYDALLREVFGGYQTLSKILDVSNDILKIDAIQLGSDEALQAIIAICQEAMGSDTSVIELYEPQSDELVGVVKFDAAYNPNGYFRIPLSENSLSSLAFNEKRVIGIDDVVNDPRVSQRIRKHFDALSGIAAPLVVEGKSIGVLLSMTNKQHRSFSETDISLMEGLANVAALAVHTQMLIVSRNEADKRFQRLIELAPISMILVDMDGSIIDANHAATKLLRIEKSDIDGKCLRDFFENNANKLMEHFQTSSDGTSVCIKTKLSNELDEKLIVEVDANTYTFSDKEVIQIFIRDITQDHHLVEEMSYLARHDPLTGLINRTEFEKRLAESLEKSRKNGAEHAVFFIDLDRFKIVNDTCGHLAGDELLKQISNLIKTCIRGVDSFARIGGDEFAILLNSCNEEKAIAIAENICRQVKNYRFVWAEEVFGIGASIGAVLIGKHSSSLEDVLKFSDTACYVAKEQGRNQVYLYHEHDENLELRQGEMSWANRIKRALDDEGFCLFEQEVLTVSVEEGEASWRSISLRMKADGGFFLPTAFYPSAQRYNLVVDIDRCLVDRSFKYIGNKSSDEKNEFYFIGLSSQSLNDENFIGFLTGTIKKYGVNPENICFQLKELEIISCLGKVEAFIVDMREKGFYFCLSGFSGGFGTISLLQGLSLDFIEVDGSAVDQITLEMIEAVCRICHMEGIKVIADSVDDIETYNSLGDAGIDCIVGNSVSEPSRID